MGMAALFSFLSNSRSNAEPLGPKRSLLMPMFAESKVPPFARWILLTEVKDCAIVVCSVIAHKISGFDRRIQIRSLVEELRLASSKFLLYGRLGLIEKFAGCAVIRHSHSVTPCQPFPIWKYPQLVMA